MVFVARWKGSFATALCAMMLVAGCAGAPGAPAAKTLAGASPTAILARATVVTATEAAPEVASPAEGAADVASPTVAMPAPAATALTGTELPAAVSAVSPLAPGSTALTSPLAGAGATAVQAPVYTYQVIHTYPHDTSAFTEGLFWDRGFLYESTGLNGSSGVRKEDLATGQVLQSVSIGPQYFGEGIATAGNDRLYELTWTSHVGFVYDLATFKPLSNFTYPTEGWGLTYDGRSLIMSDGSNVLHIMDPVSFTETSRIEVTDGGQPVTQLNELEYIRGQIFANVWQTDRIAVISPQTGNVQAWIDCTGLRPPATMGNPDAVLNGIAYDSANDRLFVTGKVWASLYEIRLVPRP
jgi:glutaminyl-peptide cyclotransferase